MISIETSTLESFLAKSPSPGLSALNSQLSTSALAAIAVLLEDLRLLRDQNRDPVLNLIHGYPRDEDGGPVPTDVFSFHADSAPIAADTWLCTYHGPPSEGLRNEDAVRKIDIPEIRAQLLQFHGGPDDASFEEFLHENHYDLHYALRTVLRSSTSEGGSAPDSQLSASSPVRLSTPNSQLSTSAVPASSPARLSALNSQLSASSPARLSTDNPQPITATPPIYSFGVAHFWRIACDYPDAPVPPCIHRAPSTLPSDPPRLLLIS
jgi:hypothetical protein